MAEKIIVNLSQEEEIKATVPDINYIPAYKVAEEERRSNELKRIANENEREAYYEDMIEKVENDYFKGEKGDKGDKGDIGLSNTLTIGTVVKGDNAEATLTGESPNQILNLTLPKGDKGEQGQQGIQGPTGPRGLQGPRGEKGEKGDKGDIGPQGKTGATGPQGPQGIQGEIGPQGEKGDTALTLNIGNVETGEPNTSASVENVGTNEDIILNFVIPQGPQGDTYEITEEDYNVIENQVKTDIQPILEEIENVANQAEVIARGKSGSVVKETFAELEEWLKDVANKGTHNIGDNLYIKAKYTDETMTERQPDYWIAEVLEEPNELGYYYEISELEADKPDLTDYAKKEQFVTLTQAEYDVLTEKSANTYYFIIEEE